MYEQTIIAAIATPPGEGGIGIIRLSGIDAAEIANRMFETKKLHNFHDAVPYMMYYGKVMDNDRIVDRGLAVYMKAPHSYTGEDVVEFQMHGSVEALRSVLSLALRHGAVPADKGEFTKRAFLNGRIDLAQAESVMDIITARGQAALVQAESHLSGALSQYVHETREKLKEFITKLEVTIDYPEEDLEDLTVDEISKALEEINQSLTQLITRSHRGRFIQDGFKTVLAGRPNAGKSSLLNALLQEDRAIVTDMPGTTRDTIEESIRIGGIPLILMDTAGIRDAENQVEAIGIERARKSMEEADLILMVIDGSVPLTDEDRRILSSLEGKKAIVILNKYDLEQKAGEAEIRSLISEETPIIHLSAQYGSGIDRLEELIQKLMHTEDLDAGRQLFLTNLRHMDLAEKSLELIHQAQKSCADKLPADFIVVDLTEAFHKLGEITGENVDDELINSIFQNFCVGK